MAITKPSTIDKNSTWHRGPNERRRAFERRSTPPPGGRKSQKKNSSSSSSSKHPRPSSAAEGRRKRDIRRRQRQQKQTCMHCDKRHLGVCRLKNTSGVKRDNKTQEPQPQPPDRGGGGRKRNKNKVKTNNPLKNGSNKKGNNNKRREQPPDIGGGRKRKKQKVKAHTNNPEGEEDSDGNCIHCSKRHLGVCRRLKNNHASFSGTGGESKKKKQPTIPALLAPVTVSKTSIHSPWKRELGGIIRYYVHHRTHTPPQTSGTTTRIQVGKEEAETEIEQLYYASQCSIPGTREAILHALGITKEMQHEWIHMSMAVEKQNEKTDTQQQQEEKQEESSTLHQQQEGGSHRTVDGKAIHLDQLQRPGEGPAHAHETWNTVIVPPWAVGHSFFFQMTNRTPLNLSCEMLLDGHRVARNVPLPGHQKRTVRPDERRYFEVHKWVLQPAKRVALHNHMDATINDNGNGNDTVVKMETSSPSQQRPRTARYNGLRPSSVLYSRQRVRLEHYPDPTMYGWKFTGSVEASCVEFFELSLNLGTVRLDFYYTTATVKTTLVHPSTGKNQLFRNTVSPEEFVEIMKNPRSHTGRGYRNKEDRLQDRDRNQDATMEEVDDDENNNDDDAIFDQNVVQEDELATTVGDTNIDDTVSIANTETDTTTKYYAKNETYDFQTQGHSNRRLEMNKLQSTTGYTKWEEAAKKEWAVVHAKFYISLPKRMRYNGGSGNGGGRSGSSQKQNNRDGSGRGNRRRKKLEKLPEQAPVIDIKSAENATLGTKFQSTGERNNPSYTYTQTKRSDVRMERVKGLTDEEEWKGGPLFEYKLYYRAEDIITANSEEEEEEGGSISSGNNNSEDMDVHVDANAGDEDENEEDLLNAYKAEKIIQVKQYHVENKAASSPEEKEEMLDKCRTNIKACDSIKTVDAAVKIYYDMVVKGHFYGDGTDSNTNTSTSL